MKKRSKKKNQIKGKSSAGMISEPRRKKNWQLVTAKIDADLHNKVKRLAESKDMTVTAVIEWAFHNFIS
jgi:hypothetical protein